MSPTAAETIARAIFDAGFGRYLHPAYRALGERDRVMVNKYLQALYAMTSTQRAGNARPLPAEEEAPCRKGTKRPAAAHSQSTDSTGPQLLDMPVVF